MPQVDYACEGRLLFTAQTTDEAPFVPRIHEIVVIDDAPYQVVDVEYWARRAGSIDRRLVSPTVYVTPVSAEDWKLRLERRTPRESLGRPPVRY